MQISIGDKYQVRTDPRNFILEAKKTVKDGKKKGEDYWEVVGYYSTLEMCLKKCIDAQMKQSEMNDVQSLITELRELKDEIVTALSAS